jgi:hypothetical protein
MEGSQATETPLGPNFPMVIEIRAEPRQELLLGSDPPIETGEGSLGTPPSGPSTQWLRMNAEDLLRQARQRSPELFENLRLLIEASYLGVVSNQRPWGM